MLSLRARLESSNLMMVKDLRVMPNNSPNPSEQAGVRIGDIVEQIDGQRPRDLHEAVAMLKNAKNSVTLVVVRK